MPFLGTPPALHRALANFITNGSFIDTKFFVFSRRGSAESGATVVDKPRALYANSFVLKERSTYFATMLSSDFSEATLTDINAGFPEHETPYVDDYGYYSDSDLDEEEDRFAPPTSSFDELEVANKNPTRLGQVIIVRDAAFSTFLAFLFFLHTGHIDFKRLKTSGTTPTPKQHVPSIRASPKSMYRLADKYGVDDLKTIALQDVRSNINSHNLMREVFSEYTSLYPEIRALEIYELSKALRDPETTGLISQQLLAKLEDYADGMFTHSSESLVELLNTLRNPPARFPRKTLPHSMTHKEPFSGDLKKAIEKALLNGIFADTKIYAYSVRSSCGRIVEPIPLWFSHTAMTSCYENFEHCAIYANGLSGVPGQSNFYANTYEYESDSDLDEDDTLPSDTKDVPSKTIDTSQSNAEEISSIFPMYMQVGAAKTWKSTLHYIYTGDTSFAPLHSQGPADNIRNHPDPRSSPKSMYVLANKLGLRQLKESAYEDIQSKLQPSNIVEEAFSKFSSTHPKILEMEVRAIMNTHRSPEAMTLLEDKIRSSYSGSSPHHSEVLKSVFSSFIKQAS